jgi:hypothetical protein
MLAFPFLFSAFQVVGVIKILETIICSDMNAYEMLTVSVKIRFGL